MTHQETMREESPRLRPYALARFREILQTDKMSGEGQLETEMEGTILPFKASNCVLEQLIGWDGIPDDPTFVPGSPQKGAPGGAEFALSSAWRSSGRRGGFSNADTVRRGERHWRGVLGI